MTFSFNVMGNMGHLGNQMFQYAFLMGISDKYSTDYIIPPKEHFGSNYNLRSSIYDAFDITAKSGISKYKQVREPHFHFSESLFNNLPGNIDIDFWGFFQTEKWFKHIESKVKEEYTFKEHIRAEAKQLRDSINSECISIHIRGTDYVKLEAHTSLTQKYYNAALSYLPKDLPLIVFTDDVKWVEDQKLIHDREYLVCDYDDPYIDMCVMSMCDYHIVANSSYSWWGSWLSNSKMTIAPRKWFGGKLLRHNIKDIHCSDWKILDII